MIEHLCIIILGDKSMPIEYPSSMRLIWSQSTYFRVFSLSWPMASSSHIPRRCKSCDSARECVCVGLWQLYSTESNNRIMHFIMYGIFSVVRRSQQWNSSWWMLTLMMLILLLLLQQRLMLCECDGHKCFAHTHHQLTHKTAVAVECHATAMDNGAR